ncbi:MAG: ABC transporter ATP-binding protein [Burkholderiales bacterium]|jgi:branched-chain amino acid transport system ATP-binding protein|nr:ABC transporter ATP-binding protein [Burkholderiales bacterium]
MTAVTSSVALLSTQGLVSHYGDFQALFGIDFTVAAGEVVAIIGANGAGKSTFLRSLVGLNRVAPAMVAWEGQPIGGRAPFDIVRLGIALVPEGRRLFPSLSVEENLRLGAHPGRPGPWNLERLYTLFPVLAERRKQPGTALSGGQQQMVAIGRALMSNPRLLLCDEISLGLAPLVIRDIYARLPQVLEGGTAVVVVEQDIGQAQRVADRIYCFQEGRVSLTGAADALTREQIADAYFGAQHSGAPHGTPA